MTAQHYGNGTFAGDLFLASQKAVHSPPPPKCYTYPQRPSWKIALLDTDPWQIQSLLVLIHGLLPVHNHYLRFFQLNSRG